MLRFFYLGNPFLSFYYGKLNSRGDFLNLFPFSFYSPVFILAGCEEERFPTISLTQVCTELGALPTQYFQGSTGQTNAKFNQEFAYTLNIEFPYLEEARDLQIELFSSSVLGPVARYNRDGVEVGLQLAKGGAVADKINTLANVANAKINLINLGANLVESGTSLLGRGKQVFSIDLSTDTDIAHIWKIE